MSGEPVRKRKKLCSGDGDGDGDGAGRYNGEVNDNGGWWEGLSPEILALIFVRISADELVRAVPFVCKSWRDVVDGPYCWSDIDVEQWCRRCNCTDRIDSAVRKLIRRSKGTCRRLSAYRLGDAGFSHVANCGRYLKVLQIPMSEVSDKMVEMHTQSLSMLTFLDISYCLKITYKGLGVLGKCCKSLIHLRRNLPPPLWGQNSEAVASKTDDEEAMVIANTMLGLRRLELGYGRFGDLGLDAILTKCKGLTHLDILGCWNVKLDGDLEDKCDRLAEFKSPWDDYYDNADSSGNDGDSVGADGDDDDGGGGDQYYDDEDHISDSD